MWGNYCGGRCDGIADGKEPRTDDGGLDQVLLPNTAADSSCHAFCPCTLGQHDMRMLFVVMASLPNKCYRSSS